MKKLQHSTSKGTLLFFTAEEKDQHNTFYLFCGQLPNIISIITLENSTFKYERSLQSIFMLPISIFVCIYVYLYMHLCYYYEE